MASLRKLLRKPRTAPRRTKRTMRRLGILLLLVLIALAAAPAIISSTSLRDTLLGMTMPEGGWSIESQEVSLSWSGTQTMTGVSIVDTDKKTLFTAESITIGRSLLALAMDRKNLGQIKINRPVVHLTTRADGSNVEDLLAAWQTGDSPEVKSEEPTQESNATLAMAIEIIDGLVQGQDPSTGRTWVLSGTNLTFRMGENMTGNTELSGVAQLADTSETGLTQTGQLKFRLQQTADNHQQLILLADRLPLGPLQSWIARAIEGGQIAGNLSADARIEFFEDPKRGWILQSEGKLETSQLRFTAAAMQGDVLACDRLTVPWKIACDQRLITVESLALDSSWAKAEASGAISYEELVALGSGRLPKHVAKISGDVDLAQLAALLPRTLQLREGVHVDSGQVRFRAQANRSEQGFRWVGRIAAKNIVGTDGQRALRWEHPIEATAQLVDSPQGARLEQLSLNAPFANARLQTAGEKISGQFDFDLEKLSAQVGQFVDLSAWEIRGEGTASLQVQQMESDWFQGVADLNLSGIQVVHNGKPLWMEPQLKVNLDAKGQQEDWTLIALSDASIQLRGAQDHVDAKLLEPKDLRNAQQAWKIKLKGTGPLERWAGRLRPWVSGTPAIVRGNANLEVRLAVASDFIDLIDLKTDVSQLHVRDDDWVVDEPRVELKGDCRWESNTGRLALRQLHLVSSTLALSSADLSVALSSDGVPKARGQVAIHANLERLAAILGQVGQADATWPRGMTQGNVTLSSDAKGLHADFSFTTDQMQIVSSAAAAAGATYGRPEVLWNEPKLKTTGKIIYQIAEDRLQLGNFQATGQTLQLGTMATVDNLTSTTSRIQAEGTVRYDSAALATLLANYLGPEILVEGNQAITFQVAGNLNDPSGKLHWSQRLQASAGAAWASASAYGMPLGAGKIQGHLQEGQLRFAPLKVAIGQGRLQMDPVIVFAPGPQQMHLARGPILTQVQVSPRVTENLLKYVAPILAGATRAEGLFSVDLDGAQIPFAAPQQAKVGGRLMVHRLRITPGPMTQDLVTLVKQIEALTRRKEFLQAATTRGASQEALSIENRQVDFQIAEGRVYHRNLEFLVDDVLVRSYGSVGFDQTLSLMLEIPIQDKWIQREKALRSLAGQSLQIPIGGTFQRPEIDQRAVVALSRQMLQGVATDAIGNEINRALDKLFKSR